MRISDWSSDVCSSDLSLACAPVVAIVIDRGQIACQAPIADEFGLRGGFVAPVFKKQGGIGMPVDVVTVQGNFAYAAHSAGGALCIDQGYPVAWIRSADTARLGHPLAVAVEIGRAHV